MSLCNDKSRNLNSNVEPCLVWKISIKSWMQGWPCQTMKTGTNSLLARAKPVVTSIVLPDTSISALGSHHPNRTAVVSKDADSIGPLSTINDIVSMYMRLLIMPIRTHSHLHFSSRRSGHLSAKHLYPRPRGLISPYLRRKGGCTKQARPRPPQREHLMRNARK